MNFLNFDQLNNYITSKQIYFTLDRFEGDFAVCENRTTGEMINILKSLFPENIKINDIFFIKNNKIVVDTLQTNSEKNDIQNLARTLFKKK